jgi:hypothetical protein
MQWKNGTQTKNFFFTKYSRCRKKIAWPTMILARDTLAWEICLAPMQILSFLRFEACQFDPATDNIDKKSRQDK